MMPLSFWVGSGDSKGAVDLSTLGG